MASVDDVKQYCNERIEAMGEGVNVDDFAVDQLPISSTSPLMIDELEKELKYTEDICKENEGVVSAIENVIGLLKRELHASKLRYNGAFVRVGSSRDGTRPGKMNEYDYLFVLETGRLKLYEDYENRECKVVEIDDDDDEQELVPADINEHFRDTVDEIFENEIQLPNDLQHAGFAHPEYSGVRRNGPATTLLFKWKGEVLVSVDITMALPLPPKKDEKIVAEISGKLKSFRQDNPETPFEVSRQVLLVPIAPNEKAWQLSTSKLEAEFIQQLHEGAPVKRIIKLEKIINSKIYVATRGTVTELDKEKQASEELVVLLREYENSQHQAELRKDVIKFMRNMHIFLPREEADQFQELSKPVASIRSYALKHLTLVKGAEFPGSFSPAARNTLTDHLLGSVFDELAHNTSDTVSHFFLDTPIPVMSWAAGDIAHKSKYFETAKAQSKSVLLKIRGQNLSQEPTSFASRIGIVEPNETPQELELHEYEKELAQKASEGSNMIIIFPPGLQELNIPFKISEICLERLGDRKQRTIHLSITKEGVHEKWSLYKRYLPLCSSIGIYESLNDEKAPFGDIVKEYDIIVTTPEFLLGQFRGGKITTLQQRNILVEQCEFANGGHPYSSLFTYLLRMRQQKSGDFIMPHVIGFTSYSGGGKRKRLQQATEQIQTFCATLDANEIYFAEDFIQQEESHLLGNFDRTKRDIGVAPSTCVHRAVDRISKRIIENLDHKLKKNSSLRVHLRERPIVCESNDGLYRTWLVGLKKCAESNLDSDEKLLMQSAYERLLLYHRTLLLVDSTLPKFGIQFLKRELGKKEKSQKNQFEDEFDALNEEYFADVSQEVSYEELNACNPRLHKLKSILIHWWREHPDMKSVVICFKLEECRAIEQWLVSEPECRDLTTAVWTGYRHDQSSKKPMDIQPVWENFISGKTRVLFLAHAGSLRFPIRRTADLIIQYWPVKREFEVLQKSDGDRRENSTKEWYIRSRIRSMMKDRRSYEDEKTRRQTALIRR